MKKDSREQNLISRRAFLGLCVGVSAGLVLPKSYAASLAAEKRVLSFYNTHTGEKLTSTYWAEGQLVQENIREIEWLLRDHRVGKVHSIDPRLLDILYTIQCRLDCRKPFHVISGYRSPKTNEMLRRITSGVAKNSYHMQGRAIDIRLPHFDTRRLRKAALSLKAGGVGYYPRSNFVHIDTGKVRSW